METKIFLGYYYNNELKSQLFHNAKWRSSCELKDSKICQVTNQKRDYIGIFLPNGVDWSTIKENEMTIQQIMLSYCPELNLSKLTLVLFPQIFVS